MKNYKLSNIKTNTNQGLKLILRQFKPFKLQIALILIFVIISTGASVFMPQLLQRAIDVDIANKDLGSLTNTTILFVIAIIVFFICSVLQTRTTGVMGQKVLFNLRAQIFKKLQQLPLGFFTQNNSGDIIIRLTGNVEGINRFFSEGLVRSVNIFFSLIGYSIFMLVLNVPLALVTIVSGIIFIAFLFFQGRVLEKRQKDVLNAEGEVSSQVQEIINGFQIIKIYEKEQEFAKRFDTKTENYYHKALRSTYLNALADGFQPFLTILSAVAVLLISFEFYRQGILTQGGVVAFFAYVTLFFRKFDGIANLWSNIQNGFASAERINEILNLESDIHNREAAYSPAKGSVKGDITFKDVSFAYEDGQVVLNNINLHIKQGRTVAIVGPTGGGKTSFVSLIARLYDVKSGNVSIDGYDVRDWKLEKLRGSVGYLIQESIFFEDTIANNLRYDNPGISDETIWNTLEQVGIKDYVETLPDKLNTIISGTGATISQGQKQILALARLLLRNPQILILDEATANIDTKTEQLIQKAIDVVRKGKTTFIIAHRLSTIVNADDIILIQNNTILESGTHAELLEKQGMYFQIYSKFAAK